MIDLNEIKTKLEELEYSVIIHNTLLLFYNTPTEFIPIEDVTNIEALPIEENAPSTIEIKENIIELFYFPEGMLTYKEEFDNVDEAIEFIKNQIPLV